MEGSPEAAAAAAAAATLVAKQLTVEHAGESLTLLLVEGAEAAALDRVLAGWLGHSRFYLTRPGDGAMVPLTAALPGGLTLSLHVPPRAGAGAAARPGATPRPSGGGRSPPEAAPDATPGRGRAHTTGAWYESPPEDSPSFGPALSRSVTSSSHPAKGMQRRGLWRAAPRGLVAGLLAEDPSPLDAGVAGHAAEPWKRGRRRRHSEGHDEVRVETATPRASSSDEDPAEHLEVERQGTGMSDSFEAVEGAMENLDRFSRLSTDLANERTLLAWMRTSMAAFRSAVTFFGLAGGFSYQAARVMMLAACVLSAFSGIRRYSKIKQATFMPVPPLDFGRISIYWFALLMVVCNLAIAAGMLSPYWVKS